MKIASIVGARPEFVQLAPLSEELKKEHKEIIIHTGQHYDIEMSKLFFNELNISKPNYNLKVGSGGHGYQTGEMIKRIEDVLINERPDLVMVRGDTNSTLAGALAAVKLHIVTAHVEAGMRSFNRKMPEEINRVLTDHCSDLLFASTETAVVNLQNEGIVRGVYNVGDVMFDALLRNKKIAENKSNILQKLGLTKKEYCVLTIHRQENTDNKKILKNIFDALISSEKQIIFPVHPRTKKYLKEYDLWNIVNESNIKVIKPLGYLDFIKLVSCSKKVLTDSGGLQKEAYFLTVPCITLREETEWVETVKDGWNVVVGYDRAKILDAIFNFSPDGDQHNYFGNGDAAKKIVDILKQQESILDIKR